MEGVVCDDATGLAVAAVAPLDRCDRSAVHVSSRLPKTPKISSVPSSIVAKLGEHHADTTYRLQTKAKRMPERILHASTVRTHALQMPDPPSGIAVDECPPASPADLTSPPPTSRTDRDLTRDRPTGVVPTQRAHCTDLSCGFAPASDLDRKSVV